ncbi:MAG TPA: FAD-dependent oxidoreductase [Chloroflexota bacterium]|nr:FAD-dependent oxidoreductase [Chloroflexota bacterium]
MASTTSPVAIIGAGPYGLSAAAYLRAAHVEAHIFGQPMEFWLRHMPAGMCLRSRWEASRIADPTHTYTLDEFQARCGTRVCEPIPLQDFIAYGQWFQRQVVPDVDRRRVTRIQSAAQGFHLLLEDGATVQARRVVIAVGLESFAWRPEHSRTLPPTLASHSSDHRSFGQFAGKQVVVVGGGQSALESAALLHGAGAEVEVVVRAPRIHWLGGGTRLLRRLGPMQGLARRVVYAPTDVGPPGLSRVVAVPALFRCLPDRLQRRLAGRCIRPAGASWLRPRLAGVVLTLGRTIVAATGEGDRVRLALDDGTERWVDHVLLATGYRVDVRRYGFLAPDLVQKVRCVEGYPDLGAGFESSVPGLHFLGAPAARSFGPLMRFVSGTWYAAPTLTRYIVTRRGRPHWVGSRDVRHEVA